MPFLSTSRHGSCTHELRHHKKEKIEKGLCKKPPTVKLTIFAAIFGSGKCFRIDRTTYNNANIEKDASRDPTTLKNSSLVKPFSVPATTKPDLKDTCTEQPCKPLLKLPVSLQKRSGTVCHNVRTKRAHINY